MFVSARKSADSWEKLQLMMISSEKDIVCIRMLELCHQHRSPFDPEGIQWFRVYIPSRSPCPAAVGGPWNSEIDESPLIKPFLWDCKRTLNYYSWHELEKELNLGLTRLTYLKSRFKYQSYMKIKLLRLVYNWVCKS